MAAYLGTPGRDKVHGTEFADLITAFAGDDIIIALAGADTVAAGAGNDTVYANSRTDWSDEAVDTVLGGAGDDHIFGGYGDVLNGGTGFDLLSLDLSGSDHGVAVNFRPMTLASLGDAVTIRIDGTELSGFQAVTDVRGSAGDDRIVIANQHRIGADVDAAGGNDLVRASTGADHLSGDAGRDRLLGLQGKDILDGGADDDRLIGGRATDVLTGGGGADKFFFADGDSPNSRAHADRITDFNHAEGDKIALRSIDAVAGGDDDRFSFIGTDRFTGTAGELRFVAIGDSTFITGDTDGDGHADFTIRLDGHQDLVRGDFQL